MNKEKQDTLFRVVGILGLAALLGLVLWARQAGRSPSHGVGHDHFDPAHHGHEMGGKELNGHQARTLTPSGSMKDGVRVVDYDAFQYGFTPDPLVVRAGEHVRLSVKSRDVMHGMMIPEVDFSTVIPTDKRQEAEFEAPRQSGAYPVFCSVFCGPDHGDMKGRLIVLPVEPSK